MVYHEWGDGFNFDRLNKAINFFSKTCRVLGGFYVSNKEKYGTMRITSLHQTDNRIRTLYNQLILNLAGLVTCLRFYDIRREISDDFDTYEGFYGWVEKLRNKWHGE